MTTPVFHGSITKGRLALDNPDRYLVYMAGLEGKRVELVLRKKRSKRSDQANRYYFGVVVKILGNFCGMDPDEMHSALKVKFLSDHHEDEKGLMKVGSTAKLSTDEFTQYVNADISVSEQRERVGCMDLLGDL